MITASAPYELSHIVRNYEVRFVPGLVHHLFNYFGCFRDEKIGLGFDLPAPIGQLHIAAHCKREHPHFGRLSLANPHCELFRSFSSALSMNFVLDSLPVPDREKHPEDTETLSPSGRR